MAANLYRGCTLRNPSGRFEQCSALSFEEPSFDSVRNAPRVFEGLPHKANLLLVPVSFREWSMIILIVSPVFDDAPPRGVTSHEHVGDTLAGVTESLDGRRL